MVILCRTLGHPSANGLTKRPFDCIAAGSVEYSWKMVLFCFSRIIIYKILIWAWFLPSCKCAVWQRLLHRILAAPTIPCSTLPINRDWSPPGADPELCFGRGIWFILLSFSYEKFLNTIVCYRNYCRLGGMPPSTPTSSTPALPHS